MLHSTIQYYNNNSSVLLLWRTGESSIWPNLIYIYIYIYFFFFFTFSQFPNRALFNIKIWNPKINHHYIVKTLIGFYYNAFTPKGNWRMFSFAAYALVSSKDVNRLVGVLNEDSDRIHGWLVRNKLALNARKCIFLLGQGGNWTR